MACMVAKGWHGCEACSSCGGRANSLAVDTLLYAIQGRCQKRFTQVLVPKPHERTLTDWISLWCHVEIKERGATLTLRPPESQI